MEKKNNNSGFMFGLIFGAITGAILMTLFGTKEGKKFIKRLRRKIDELIREVEDEADDTQKLLVSKAKHFKQDLYDKASGLKSNVKLTQAQVARKIGDKLFSKQGKSK